MRSIISNNIYNELTAKYPSVPIQFMGIPSEEASKKIVDWQNEDLWK